MFKNVFKISDEQTESRRVFWSLYRDTYCKRFFCDKLDRNISIRGVVKILGYIPSNSDTIFKIFCKTLYGINCIDL